MKQYDTYKDSGIEWIGAIPSHWEILKLKYHFSWEKGKNATLYTNEYVAQNIGNYPVYSGQTENDGILGRIDSFDYSINKYVLLVTTVGAKAMTLRKIIGYFSLSQNCAIIKDNYGEFDMHFAYYFIQQLFNYEKRLISLIMQPSLRFEDLNTYYTIKPSIKEQTAIAKYLDQKTAEIDELIADKKHLLELYEEEKTAIINQAVNKGVDPKAKMKDSGIEWLGEIPVHWEVKKLRYLGECQNGITKSAEAFGKGYPFLSYSDVYKNYEIPIELTGLVDSNENDRINYSVQEGDVFFTRTSETIEEIGIASTCLQTISNAVFAGFLIRFRPNTNRLFNGYNKYYFRAQIHRKYFVKEMNLVTRASLSQELLKKLPVLLPPYEEQQSIVRYIETECTSIDAKIAKTQKLIELLTEYRTALISEVVTGKIKVMD